jgi:hypothetical protein
LRLSNIGDCCSTGRVGNVKGSKVRPEQASWCLTCDLQEFIEVEQRIVALP